MDIDIYDVGRHYLECGNTQNAKVGNREIDNYFSGSFFLGGCNFFLKFIYFLINGRHSFPLKNSGGKDIIFYGTSRNNRVTLLPIINKLPSDSFVSFLYQKEFPSWKLYWYALPHLRELIEEIKSADEGKKELFKLFFPKFWRMYGFPKVVNEMLDTYRPKIIVLANDHLEFNRYLATTAKSRGIKTMYLQHASVGTHFPPLRFDYSMLDGKDAYEKYKAVGDIEGNVFLCGGVRFDVIKKENCLMPQDTVIGIAINLVDDAKRVKDFCLQLKASLPSASGTKIVLRPHPQMGDGTWDDWCAANGFGFSSPSAESSFEFIGGSTIVIANQCSIHLDTAMCHKHSIVYNMSDRPSQDVYLFKKNGLVVEAADIDDVVRMIYDLPQQEIDSDSVRYYNYSFNREHEGHIADVVSHLLEAVINESLPAFYDKYGLVLESCSANSCVYRWK